MNSQEILSHFRNQLAHRRARRRARAAAAQNHAMDRHERTAKGDPARTRRHRPSRSGDTIAGCAPPALATTCHHRFRGCRASACTIAATHGQRGTTKPITISRRCKSSGGGRRLRWSSDTLIRTSKSTRKASKSSPGEIPETRRKKRPQMTLNQNVRATPSSLHTGGVTGSIPVPPTIFSKSFQGLCFHPLPCPPRLKCERIAKSPLKAGGILGEIVPVVF
jgi:hypothetical protein